MKFHQNQGVNMKRKNDIKGALSILFLEDSQRDFEIIRELLTDEEYDMNMDRVENGQEFVSALQKKKYNIILADFNLPEYDVFDALKRSNEICPDVPFIVVSGNIGEESAIELLKQGAVDYVLKDRPARLSLAIKRALEGAKEKEARKLSETALNESTNFNTSLLQTIPFGMSIVDVEGNILFLSEKFKKLFGQEAIGEKCWNILKDGKCQCVDCPLYSGIKIGETSTYETDGILEGKTFQIIHTGMFYQGKKAMLEIFQDITERKYAEQIQQLLYNISNATNITDNLTDLVVQIEEQLGTIIDTTNFFIALYDEKTDMFSLPHLIDEKEELKSFPAGKTMTNYVLKTQKCLLAKHEGINNLIKSGDVEMAGTAAKIWLGVPLNVKGKSIGVIAVQSYTDENAYNESDREMLEFVSEQISVSVERKIYEEELKKALFQALESDRLKSSFLANMSHEIRTPMNGILGFLNLLNDPNLSKTQVEDYSAIINKSSDRLLNTINDIIDIAKVEAGEMIVSNTETSVNSIMDEIYSFHSHEAKLKGLSLLLEPSTEQLAIITDSPKLFGILTNLVKNAIKCTEKGSITFGYVQKKDTEPAEVEFYVEDTGIGIPKNRIQAIFNRFEQAEIGDARRIEGSGLGLAISKAYVEMLGGKIFVESEEGKGSRFTFTIPLNEIQEEGTMKTSETIDNNTSKFGNLNLLIVDDDDVSLELLKTILKGIFHKIIFAETGIEAVKLCKNSSEIDLVLLDIRMPEMDGLDAIREIRKFNKDLLIIAQTAYAMPDDKRNIIEAGFNDYISKPINKKLLLEVISRHVSKKAFNNGYE